MCVLMPYIKGSQQGLAKPKGVLRAPGKMHSSMASSIYFTASPLSFYPGGRGAINVVLDPRRWLY